MIKLLFSVILVLAIFFRFFNLNSLPPSLNWDEVSIGYNAYSILKTGKDEWGQFLPLSFKAYGEYKLPGYVYLDVPFIAIFGLNEWGVRLPSAFVGLGLVILIYFFAKILLENQKLALIAMFLAAITPWPLILSRIALEANLALFLTTGGVFCFILGLKKKNALLVSLSAVLFGLSIFSYNSSRIVTPLLILLISGFFWRDARLIFKKLVPALVIFLVFFITALPLAALQDSSARYKWTTILDQGAINNINEKRGIDSTVIGRLTNNKIVYFAEHASINYLLNFDPNFLFIKGGSNYQFSVPQNGLLYLIYLPFLLGGLYFAFKAKNPFWFFVFGWLFLAPLPAAITRDSPHALRSLMMIPPLLLITSLGIIKILDLSKKYFLFCLSFILITLLSFIFFWKNYSIDYVKNYSWSWQYGYKQVAGFIKEEVKYDKIYITKKYGEPHEFLLFYLKVSPKTYQQDPNLIRYDKSDWSWVDRFNNFYFINDWEVKDNFVLNNDKVLLITSPGNYPDNGRFIKTINFIDGKPAFDIVGFNI